MKTYRVQEKHYMAGNITAHSAFLSSISIGFQNKTASLMMQLRSERSLLLVKISKKIANKKLSMSWSSKKNNIKTRVAIANTNQVLF